MFASDRYSEPELDELTAEVRACCERSEISKTPYQNFRKAAGIIKSYRAKGCLDKHDMTALRGYKFALCDEFEKLVKLYVDKIGEYRSLSANTLPTRRGLIRSFLAQLERQGIKTAAGITCPAISTCITERAREYSPGSKSWIHYTRQFLWFLHETGITAEDFSMAVPDTLPRKRVVRPGFSEDEVGKILDAVDRASLNGKRDYAFILTAARTGLRGIDIIKLKLGSIDWRSKEIRIAQQKTGYALSLPLSPEVGNAIADYILNERPESKSEYVFVKRSCPSQPYSRQCSTAIVKKHMGLLELTARKFLIGGATVSAGASERPCSNLPCRLT